MPRAHNGISPDMLQDRGAAALVSVHLCLGPRIGSASELVIGADVLGFNPDQVRVAVRDAFPVAHASVPSLASGYDPENTRARKTEITEWAAEIRATIHKNMQVAYIAIFRATSMMTQDALSFAK